MAGANVALARERRRVEVTGVDNLVPAAHGWPPAS
jgi:hypothetical protein